MTDETPFPRVLPWRITADSENTRLKAINADLLAALEAIANDTAEFEHGDGNMELFVRGLGYRASAAIAKAKGIKE